MLTFQLATVNIGVVARARGGHRDPTAPLVPFPLKGLAFFHDEVRGETTQMLKAKDQYILYNRTDLCTSVEAH